MEVLSKLIQSLMKELIFILNNPQFSNSLCSNI